MICFVLLIFLLTPSKQVMFTKANSNISLLLPTNLPVKANHMIVENFGWHALSGVGIVGTVANVLIIHTFYAERVVITSSVNAMIIMESLHRVVYGAVTVHWRNYNMVMDTPLLGSWIGDAEVR